MTGNDPKPPVLIGWQTLLADLSLILFMVTAAAMATQPGSPTHAAAAPAAPAISTPAPAESLALWRAGGSQSLRHWLADEQPDSRQQLTITVRYAAGGAAQALVTTRALVGEAGALGRSATVSVAPATAAMAAETLASLTYDRTPSQLDPRGR